MFTPDVLTDALRDLAGAARVKEAAILSTCNRTEVYFAAAIPTPVGVLARATSTACPTHALAPYVYTLPREKAVTHAFRVASGLDSMVLGEPQILGQMKQAVRSAEVGRLARARAESTVPAHVRGREGRAHADRHRQRVDLDGRGGGEARRAHLSRRSRSQRLLLVGAGEMIELAASALRCAKTPKSVTVANRTLERGSKLADRLGARCDHAERAARAPARVRHHRHLHGEHAADHRQGHARARGQAAQARAGVHRRPRRAARRRSRRRRDLDDVFLYSVDELAVIVQREPADPAGSGGAGRADDRRPDRAFPALAGRPLRGADDRGACPGITRRCAPPSSTARAGCWRRGASPDAGARRARARPHEQAAACAAVGAQRRRRSRARASSSRRCRASIASTTSDERRALAARSAMLASGAQPGTSA